MTVTLCCPTLWYGSWTLVLSSLSSVIKLSFVSRGTRRILQEGYSLTLLTLVDVSSMEIPVAFTSQQNSASSPWATSQVLEFHQHLRWFPSKSQAQNSKVPEGFKSTSISTFPINSSVLTSPLQHTTEARKEYKAGTEKEALLLAGDFHQSVSVTSPSIFPENLNRTQRAASWMNKQWRIQEIKC